MVTDSANNTNAPEAQAPESPAGRIADVVASSWNVSLETLRANLSHNDPEALDVFVWCYLWCTDAAHPLTVADFAAELAVDKTTITRLMQGTYKHPTNGSRLPISPTLLKTLQRWRRRKTDRALAKETDFVLTPTAQRIFTACDLARESQSPVFLTGPSHVGKTKALKEYKEKNNHGRTIYVRLQAANGLGGMVRAIAAAVGGIGLKANTVTLIASIKANLTPAMLLILDEVHELIYTYRKESFFSCVEVIREIYDATGCGMVLCGTDLLLKRITDNRGELEQLLRRGVHKVKLADQPTKGDCTAILEDAGLSFPDRNLTVAVSMRGVTITEQPFEILRQIGKEEGLKSICERIRYGVKLAAKAKTALTWEHVVRAHLTIKQNALPQNDWE